MEEHRGQVVGLFARKLEERRVASGLFHGEFAAQIGCHPSVWTRIRTGQRGVSLELAQKVIRIWPEFWDYYTAEVLPQPAQPVGGGSGEKGG